MRDIEEFKVVSDAIAVNCVTDELNGVEDKVYTRGIYSRDLVYVIEPLT